MSRYNKRLGDFGEAVAAQYLKDRGFSILETNYRTRSGEIDLICMDKNTLVFVEVKTRNSDKFGHPSEAVDEVKLAHMYSVAEDYYRQHPTDAEIRFDVVEVYAAMRAGVAEYSEINHITNIQIY